MENKRILLLGRRSATTNIVYNYLEKQFGVAMALTEGKEDPVKYLKRRIRKLGLLTVLGQIGFRVLVARLLSYFSKGRLAEIAARYQLDMSPIPSSKEKALDSVNSPEAIRIIEEMKPDLIVVNGTRILSKKLLAAAPCKIMNIHAGITPGYRGVHGMYWALVNKDPENAGVTVHLVDAGVDTGHIIAQKRIKPEAADNFATYNYLQLSEGLALLGDAIRDEFAGRLSTHAGEGASKQWYHPTLRGYLYHRIFRGVK